MKGSCACQGIQYELVGEILFMNHCHCSICRKIHGAAFGTFGHAKAEEFRWLKGEELIASYVSSEHNVPGFEKNVRNFCRVCGSNVPSVFPAIDYVRIPMGTVDDDPGMRPSVHLFVASKAPWSEICDQLPQHAEMPETFMNQAKQALEENLNL
ncbi:GFA family protein [Scytonema sp. PCC 10023]|uniref:GFA family protein n=1 Tax=Scytonema sp. PCC 10023 TaxID=1680591 RepID=UPI0039C67076